MGMITGVDVAFDDSERIGSSETVGVTMAVASYLEKIGFVETVNRATGPIRSPNADRWDHGRTAAVLLMYLFVQPRVISRVEHWVANSTYLHLIYPGIHSHLFSEDRLEQTLDAIFHAGIDGMMLQQGLNIIRKFDVKVETVYADMSNYSVWGEYLVEDEPDAIKIVHGKPKSHRSDLLQFASEAAVTDDGAVPVWFKSLDGNTADVTRYVPIWEKLRKMATTDFIMVGDCKLASAENLADISEGGGFYLAPEYETNYTRLAEDLERAPLKKTVLKTRARGKGQKSEVAYTGFETAAELKDASGRTHPMRRLIVHSTALEKLKTGTIDEHEGRTRAALDDLVARSGGRRTYKEKKKLDAAIDRILGKYGLSKAFKIEIEEHVETAGRHARPGRPPAGAVPGSGTPVTWYSLKSYEYDEHFFDDQRRFAGYFVLVTNKPERDLPLREALNTYKKQYKVEQVFHRINSTFSVIPIYLHLPRRIMAMMFLLFTGVQIMALIDRTAEMSLAEADSTLVGLHPKDRATMKPTSEFMFQMIGRMNLVFKERNGRLSVTLSQTENIEHAIMHIIGVDEQLYSPASLGKSLLSAYEQDTGEFVEVIERRVFLSTLNLCNMHKNAI